MKEENRPRGAFDCPDAVRETLLALLGGARWANVRHDCGRPARIAWPADAGERAALVDAHVDGRPAALTFHAETVRRRHDAGGDDAHGARGLSVKSSNHSGAAIRGFALWLTTRLRLPENPLDGLRALTVTRADRKRVRRAMEAGELAALLDTTRASAELFGMVGTERRRTELQHAPRAKTGVDGNRTHQAPRV